jgi:DNA-binding winged helix-turn-helix (wHTH) protein/Tol biopolymer transport system component
MKIRYSYGCADPIEYQRMAMDQTSTPSYEFEGFRLDTVLQVLTSADGEPIVLPSRAFETLRYLVERSGELVEKSALMKAVWPRAVVEENNLNQCIFTLRKVMGEVAGERRFILTVPGRGFKFVAPVNVIPNPGYVPANTEPSLRQPVPASVEPVASVPAAMPAATRKRRRLWIMLALACLAGLAIGAASLLFISHSPPVTSSAEYESLTDMADSATAPALSPDGRLLAFIKGGDPFLSPGQIWLKLLPDGEPFQLTHTSGLIFAPTFTPDGTHVAYSAVEKEPGGAWDTWIVPIAGGEAVKLLPNASALSYIGPHEVMYSEFKTGLHLGIVSSLDDRSQHREIYLPSHERAMAHFSYLSPDRKSVLVVEMDRTANFQRCRLVPFDGSSPGTFAGPAGACMFAAWAPRGDWMYFSVQIGGHSHLWRQRYPDGQPQQITFGPTDEETVACTPDGRSLLTSLGREQSRIWLHSGGSERVLTTESYASSPWLSSDGHRVYFLAARSSTDPSELWRVEVASGRKESLLAGFAISGYSVSSDEQQVVFTTIRDSASQIWIAPLDRHAPPVLLFRGGDEVAFDAAGNIFFRSLGEHVNYLHRMRPDGRSNVRVLETPIVEFHAVAPDGRWVSVDLPIEGGIAGAFLAPVGGGTPSLVRRGWWPSQWSRDGHTLYVEVGTGENSQRHGRTAALPIGADGLPTESVLSVPETMLIPHPELSLSIGSDPSVYTIEKGETHRNIYRIPIHN